MGTWPIGQKRIFFASIFKRSALRRKLNSLEEYFSTYCDPPLIGIDFWILSVLKDQGGNSTSLTYRLRKMSKTEKRKTSKTEGMHLMIVSQGV